jgi:ABC-type nitrate/sulfonate/bicarbonate transport system ATPase subunit
MDPVLTLETVSRTFSTNEGTCPALAGVSFEAHKKEILCIMGPSGCGKTTLLRIIARLDKEDSGSIRISGEDNRYQAQTAMVFQDHSLFPWLTIHDNIVYGLRLGSQKQSEEEIKKRAERLLVLTRLESFSGSYPHQLSGGMKQRASVARALAVSPRILLLDEPFSALDPFTRRELEDEILRIRAAAHESGNDITILLVTHNPEEAVYLGDRIIVLSDRPGRIRDIVSVDLPHPRNVADPGFLEVREHVAGLVKR